MKKLWVIIAILSLVLAGSAYAAMPAFTQFDMAAPEFSCSDQGCENTAHSAMPVSECLAHCLKSGIEAAGTAVFAFTSQFLGFFLAAFSAVSAVAVYGIFRQKLRERGDFAKLFLERNLRGVILLN